MRNKIKTYNKFFIDVIDSMIHPIISRNFIIDSEVFLFDTDRWIYEIKFYPTKGDKKSETLQTVIIEVGVDMHLYHADGTITFNSFSFNGTTTTFPVKHDIPIRVEMLCQKLESLL